MSEINAEIKKLIFEGRREEAIDELMNSYSLDRDKAEEFVRRFEEANKKKIKPGVAQNLAKGCGCISIFFVIAFALALFTGIRGVLNDVKVEAEVIGYETEEFTDQFDAKIETYYTPQVRYTYQGETYEVGLTSVSTEAEYTEGEIIEVYIDPEYPESASTYHIGSAIGDAAVWLILAGFAFGGYWFIRNMSIKINKPLQEMQAKMEEMKAKAEELKEQAELRPDASENPELKEDSSITSPTEHAKIKKSFTTIPKREVKELNPLVLVGLGVVFIFIGIGLGYWKYQSNQHRRALEEGDVVIGMVTSERKVRRSSSSSSSIYDYGYTLEYEYKNKFYTYDAVFSFDDYNSGDQVELRVNPDDPNDVAINRSDDLSGGGSYFWGFILIFAGGWFIKWGFQGHQRWKAEGKA